MRFMIKSKGRAKGKVYMPKKPVKRGFKVWSLSCSCCGYLCNFQLYAGKCTKRSEKGLAKRVVLDLVEPYVGLEHVVYLDNYFYYCRSSFATGGKGDWHCGYS